MIFVCVLSLLPLLSFAQEEKTEVILLEDKTDDHNTLPVGILKSDVILSGAKIFNYRYVEYAPKSDAVQTLHNFSQPLEIKVFFGDWCKDSKRHVPSFTKTMEFSDNKNIQVTYINIDRQMKEPADLLTGWNIENVPTFVVLLSGTEIGRVIETPKVSIEQDLAEILAGH